MFLRLGNMLVNITGLFLVEIPVIFFFFFFTFIFHFLTYYKIFLYPRIANANRGGSNLFIYLVIFY